MSGALGLASRLTVLLQGAPLVAFGVAGLLLGAGSVLVVGQAGPSGSSGAALPLFACPDGRTRVGELQPGDQVLVTGRTGDGSWLQVHVPSGGSQDRAWAETAAFRLDGAFTSLPNTTCEASGGLLAGGPAATLTAVARTTSSPTRPAPTVQPTAQAAATPSSTPQPTPAPTPVPTPVATPTPTPRPTPTPTPAPDTRPPALANLSTDATAIYTAAYYTYCTPTAANISVDAADNVGVVAVTLYYRLPNATAYNAAPMALDRGTATQGTWLYKLQPSPTWPTGSLTYYAFAADAAKNTAEIAAKTLTLNLCIG